MRYRIKFAKDGLAVYISHLDLMRTWERALRRAGLRLAFSAGFNPHPKMSFALAQAHGDAGADGDRLLGASLLGLQRDVSGRTRREFRFRAGA